FRCQRKRPDGGGECRKRSSTRSAAVGSRAWPGPAAMPQVLPRTVSVLRGAEIAIGCHLLRCRRRLMAVKRTFVDGAARPARPDQGVGADRAAIGREFWEITTHDRVCGTSCWRATRNSPDNCLFFFSYRLLLLPEL